MTASPPLHARPQTPKSLALPALAPIRSRAPLIKNNLMIQFDQRDLPRAAEPVHSDQLSIGETYFNIAYADEAMTIPVMESLVYIGKNLDDDESDNLYFQDVESYRAGARITDPETDSSIGTLYAWPPGGLNSVFEFERGLEELLQCFIRRKNI